MFRKLFSWLIILAAGYSSCNLFPKVKCSECYSFEPDSADIKMLFTINAENPKVPLIVYKGKVENGKIESMDSTNIEWIDTTNSETLYLYVRMNHYYSVVAKYKSGARTIYAVDGDKLISQNQSDACSEDCYIIIHNELDLRLKE